MQPQQCDRERPQRSHADHSDRLARHWTGLLKTVEDNGRRLYEYARVVRHMIGQRVDELRGDGDQLRIAAGTREADRLDVLAPVRLAAAAAGAAVAGDEALAYDAVTRLNRLDGHADLKHGARPLVAR